ncbi:hypothetical protein [Agarilytica rhodophyticola]|uniref:hypothetical protein n=1 Tax=Agarilytica rhodophyticola TaxID=1737490 RepID=UPI000CD9AB18|nr:hypothetical protein [Agarilytica rhodophyticola]
MSKEFIKQRICIYAGMDIDPTIDSQVVEILKKRFNVLLPQRASLDEALEAAVFSHEIISLIIKYRSLVKSQSKRN